MSKVEIKIPDDRWFSRGWDSCIVTVIGEKGGIE